MDSAPVNKETCEKTLVVRKEGVNWGIPWVKLRYIGGSPPSQKEDESLTE